MKAVILAGGFGTRLSEETEIKPKPMIEIGGKPILWHILKIYSFHGINDFIICCGYKGHLIKNFFKNFFLQRSDITIDLKKDNIEIHNTNSEPWKVSLIDTGENTNTGGRLKRVKDYLDDKETFCFTYGDGLADINIFELIKFHKKHGKKATLTATYPPGRFGALDIDSNNIVKEFKEKPVGDGNWINGGFFVLQHDVLDYIDNDKSSWEFDVLTKISKDNQLSAFKHRGFWQPMDTLREKRILEKLWASGNPPWKIWK